MGRVIRTFITAVDVLGERISALPQRLPTAAKERRQGHGCLPVPFLPTQRLTAPNGGGIVRGSMTEKKWLLLCQRRIKIQQAAESPWPGSARFLLSDLRPSGRKSGCGRQPAKSVWLPAVSQTLCLPHPWVGKTAFPGRASTGGTSALRTARRCGMVFPALFSTVHFSLIGGANRSGLVAQTGRGWEPGQRASAGHTAPTRPCSAPPGLRSHPVSREAHRSAQGEVGDASVFPIAEEQSRFLCIAYQNLTGEGVSGKRFRLQNLPQIFVCSPGKIPLEFLKLPV